jgi:hypothetical protein
MPILLPETEYIPSFGPVTEVSAKSTVTIAPSATPSEVIAFAATLSVTILDNAIFFS